LNKSKWKRASFPALDLPQSSILAKAIKDKHEGVINGILDICPTGRRNSHRV
jgi:hypothetical protein